MKRLIILLAIFPLFLMPQKKEIPTGCQRIVVTWDPVTNVQIGNYEVQFENFHMAIAVTDTFHKEPRSSFGDSSSVTVRAISYVSEPGPWSVPRAWIFVDTSWVPPYSENDLPLSVSYSEMAQWFFKEEYYQFGRNRRSSWYAFDDLKVIRLSGRVDSNGNLVPAFLWRYLEVGGSDSMDVEFFLPHAVGPVFLRLGDWYAPFDSASLIRKIAPGKYPMFLEAEGEFVYLKEVNGKILEVTALTEQIVPDRVNVKIYFEM